jgi:transcriptional regulator with XRE-family HTH domain
MANSSLLPQRHGDLLIVSVDPARLTARRKAAGYTQASLAALMETNASFISQLERGVKNAAIDTVRRLASVLTCDVEDITVTVPVTDTRSAP